MALTPQEKALDVLKSGKNVFITGNGGVGIIDDIFQLPPIFASDTDRVKYRYIRKSESENARLQAKIELLENLLAEQRREKTGKEGKNMALTPGQLKALDVLKSGKNVFIDDIFQLPPIFATERK